jgi:hypothetical protein
MNCTFVLPSFLFVGGEGTTSKRNDLTYVSGDWMHVEVYRLTQPCIDSIDHDMNERIILYTGRCLNILILFMGESAIISTVNYKQIN